MTANPYTVSPYLRDPRRDLSQADLSWQSAAVCAQADPEAWFPRQGEPARRAKLICRACPVRENCLADALEHMGLYEYGTHGVWGGLSPGEREAAAAEYAQGTSLRAIIINADINWDAQLAAAAEHADQRLGGLPLLHRVARVDVRVDDPQSLEHLGVDGQLDRLLPLGEVRPEGV
jgi:WhiB family redox-sensing transcriptional regulator